MQHGFENLFEFCATRVENLFEFCAVRVENYFEFCATRVESHIRKSLHRPMSPELCANWGHIGAGDGTKAKFKTKPCCGLSWVHWDNLGTMKSDRYILKCDTYMYIPLEIVTEQSKPCSSLFWPSQWCRLASFINIEFTSKLIVTSLTAPKKSTWFNCLRGAPSLFPLTNLGFCPNQGGGGGRSDRIPTFL